MSRTEWRVAAPGLEHMTSWRQMRQALWPKMTEEENFSETESMLTAESRFFIRVALDAQGKAVGFAEAALRTDPVNGCATSPVVFLEGIYVEQQVRRQGVARALVHAVEEWGRKIGCREFASDALLENTSSHSMHRGLGFEETERVVYFRKQLLS